ncbi:MAG: MFS transporter [Gammaproteobacteria bacterium]|nr:MFS transporter [Gammaproteobacteria bacterium]MDP6617123.1 MFS transporter [Gammaproteobacteria bacterium]MDP6695767.1 MFS transporter [Gammaproteobacteria bacterium]
MPDHRTFSIDKTQRHIGPIWLSPGIAPRNVFTLFVSAAMAIGFINLLNLIQPLLLQEQLGMTTGEGDFTANVYIALEITSLIVVIPLANLSDITGRRPIFTSGFLIICLGLIIIPTATTGFELMLYRIFTSVGVACCTTMMASLAADYPQNASRGKFIGINGIFAALGVIIVGSGLTQLPKLFASMGYTVTESTSFTLWIGGVLAIVTAAVTFTGIKKGRVAGDQEKLPYLENMRIGFSEIRGNPRLILGCGATALSRGDLTVLATFFALWVQKVGADQGIEAVSASATAGRLFGLMQMAMLLFMPVIAIIVDRLDRVTALSISISLAAVGYFALGFAPNPFESDLIYIVAVLAGIGEAVILVSVPSLIGQEAPARFRGSIIGVAASFGAVGIILTNKASGYLFDNWSYQGPFIFMALLNSSALLWTVSVRLKTGTTRDQQQAMVSTEN